MVSHKTKAHIPPETTFALAKKRREYIDKQHEIDKPKANPTRKLPNMTIFHRLALGLTLNLWFALGPRGFLDTSMR